MFAAKNELLTRPSGYKISRSLRFRSSASAYLSRTQTAGSQTTWTWSAWVKLGALSSASYIFQAGGSGGSGVYYNAPTGELQVEVGNNTTQYYARTSALFRDPSAWYHVVALADTSNATSTDRLRLYINGVRQTIGTSSYPTSGFTGTVNQNTVVAVIGRFNGATPAYYLDGYLAEVNFIDGQALTPSSFGAYDTNGVWQPKAYTGTYGTNGFYLPFTLNSTSTYAGSFNGSSQSLSTPSTTVMNFGSSNYTIETWVKTTQTTQYATLISKTPSAFSTGMWTILLNNTASGDVAVYMHSYNTGTTHMLLSSGVTVNDGNWHHIALVRNGSAHTLYVDGISRASVTSSFTVDNLTAATYIGQDQYYSRYFNGQLSNVRIVNGTAVYTSNFTPSSSALTAVTNTQLLCLQSASATQDNSANAFTLTNTGTVTTSTATPFVSNITSDASGQNNGWASNNINYTTSGTTYDSMIDSPTNYADGGNGRGNYATFNPLWTGTGFGTFTNGNLTYTQQSAANTSAIATIGVTSGKWYFETTFTALQTGSDPLVGVVNTANQTPTNAYPGQTTTGYSAYTISSNTYLQKVNGGTLTNTNQTIAVAGDIINVAVDMDNGKIWFGKNGTWCDSGNPATGANAQFTGLTGTLTPAFRGAGGAGVNCSLDVNFGQRPFTYTPPSGFLALNTQNLP